MIADAISQRTHIAKITSLWRRRFDVVMTLFLRRVPVGMETCRYTDNKTITEVCHGVLSLHLCIKLVQHNLNEWASIHAYTIHKARLSMTKRLPVRQLMNYHIFYIFNDTEAENYQLEMTYSKGLFDITRKKLYLAKIVLTAQVVAKTTKITAKNFITKSFL